MRVEEHCRCGASYAVEGNVIESVEGGLEKWRAVHLCAYRVEAAPANAGSEVSKRATGNPAPTRRPRGTSAA